MNFLALQNRVIQKLAETASPKFWTLDEIKFNLNRGAREFSLKTGFHVSTATLTPSGDGYVLPTDILDPKALYLDGSKLDQTTSDYLDAMNPAWRSEIGAPTRWLIEGGLVRLHPQRTALTTVSMRYAPVPADLVGDTDTPSIPAGYHEALVQWALFECFSRDGDGQDLPKSQLYTQMFQASVDSMVRALSMWNKISSTDSGNTLDAMMQRVAMKIQDSPAPVKFSLGEIKSALNRGYLEFVRAINHPTTKVGLTRAITEGEYLVPSDLLAPVVLYCDGIPVDHVDVTYVDNLSSTNRANKIGLVGDGTDSVSRVWYYGSNGNIVVYPAPEEDSTLAVSGPGAPIFGYPTIGVLDAGQVLYVDPDLEQDEDIYLFHLGGFLQDPGTWEFNAGTSPLPSIQKVGGGDLVDGKTPWMLMPLPDTHTQQSGTAAAGAVDITLVDDEVYLDEDTALLFIGGVLQAEGTWSFGTGVITLNAPLPGGASWVLVYAPASEMSSVIELRYVAKPADLTTGSQSPTAVPESYRDAIWCYAVFDCLSRTGDAKNDRVAQVHLNRFQQLVTDFTTQYQKAVMPDLALPFRV